MRLCTIVFATCVNRGCWGNAISQRGSLS